MKIAFFDFDGTLTTRDTMFVFLREAFGTPYFWRTVARTGPTLVAYKAGLLANERAKERLLSNFLKGRSVDDVESRAARFGRQTVPDLLRPGAEAELAALQAAGYQIVVVTASAELWVAPWCQARGYDLIGTQLDATERRFTGRLRGANCHGPEKVRRIRARYDLSRYEQIRAYGDTAGDLPMLELTTDAFYRPFRRGWRPFRDDAVTP